MDLHAWRALLGKWLMRIREKSRGVLEVIGVRPSCAGVAEVSSFSGGHPGVCGAVKCGLAQSHQLY